MPYMTQADREALDAGQPPISAGDLNYVITQHALRWLGPAPRYTAYNAVIGVLECAKLELYRRAVACYEDAKCAQNGDVYHG